MIKKTLLIAAFSLSTVSLWAQEELQPYPLKWGAGIDLGYGTALDLTMRGQYYINKHLTWDVLQLRLLRDFSNNIDTKKYLTGVSFTTGLRAYTPTFGPNLKAFAAAGVGCGYYHTQNKFFAMKSAYIFNETYNLAADFSAGLFVWQGIYVSYDCQLLHNGSRGNHIDHFVNLGFELGSFRLKSWTD